MSHSLHLEPTPTCRCVHMHTHILYEMERVSEMKERKHILEGVFVVFEVCVLVSVSGTDGGREVRRGSKKV